MNWLNAMLIRVTSNAERVCLIATVPLTLGLAMVVGGVAFHSVFLTTIGFALFGLSASFLLILLLVTMRE